MKHSELPNVYDVAIGALLHDIGKLLQRSSSTQLTEAQRNRASDVLPSSKGKYSHWHALWSDAFFDWVAEEQLPWPKDVNPNWVRDLAVYHHSPAQPYPNKPEGTVTQLVTVADRLASGYELRPRDIEMELNDGNRERFRRTPMKAIVASLELQNTIPELKGYHLPRELDAEALLPSPNSEGAEIGDRTFAGYGTIWQGFQDGWRQLARTLGQESRGEVFEEGLLGLCERWLWSVPSSAMDEPDVSLFDHSRAVSAFAAALYQHHAAREELTSPKAIHDRERPKFRFLVGDLSGLQSTLFRLHRERIRGLNRILRGRSLRFQLIADAGTRRALQEFEMPWSAALQTAGGRFLILLPDLGNTEMCERTGRLRTEFDKWMAHEYTGDLGIGLALSQPFSAHDLVKADYEIDDTEWNRRTNKVRENLTVAVETAKLRQLETPAAQAVQHLDYPYENCSSCGVRPAEHAKPEDSEAYCLSCRAESELGRRFPKSHKVLIESGSRLPTIFGLSYRLHDSAQPGDELSKSLGWRFGKEGQRTDRPAAFRPGTCYVPRYSENEVQKFRRLEDHAQIGPGDVKSFEVLAEYSIRNGKGRKMMAVLMADVDRLGRLFVDGTGPRWNLARTATLSRMIDGYFSIRLPNILENQWENIYTVYAGGDDLLLLGPWQDIFKFAAKLQEDFSRFSLKNPNVTLSASIELLDVKAPVSAAARGAQNRLADAKANGRDKISAIEEIPMSWDRYRQALENATKLDDFLQDETLSIAALYRFLSLSESAFRIINQSAKPEDYAWRAKLGYTLVRNLPKHATNEQQRAAFDLVVRLFGLDRQLSGILDDVSGVQLAISHAIYRNRGRQ